MYQTRINEEKTAKLGRCIFLLIFYFHFDIILI